MQAMRYPSLDSYGFFNFADRPFLDEFLNQKKRICLQTAYRGTKNRDIVIHRCDPVTIGVCEVNWLEENLMNLLHYSNIARSAHRGRRRHLHHARGTCQPGHVPVLIGGRRPARIPAREADRMSAGFSPASLRRLRSWATGLMTDECRIVSHGRPVNGPPTPEGDQSRNGPVRGPVQSADQRRPRRREHGGRHRPGLGRGHPLWSLYLHLPYGTTGLSSGDVAEITAATDPNLKGRKFRLLNMQSEKRTPPHAGGTSRK